MTSTRMRWALAALAWLLGLLPAAATGAGGPDLPRKSRFQPVAAAAAPTLEARDLGGVLHRLPDYRGKVVLVNFWATWCEPCRDEMPSMQRLARRLEGRPFVILAVNFGESQVRVREFLAKVPVDFTILLDSFQEAGRAWNARILPASYLVGTDGRIRYRVAGEVDWEEEHTMNTITSLLPR